LVKLSCIVLEPHGIIFCNYSHGRLTNIDPKKITLDFLWYTIFLEILPTKSPHFGRLFTLW
jgi:hypothetical protein